MRKPRIPAWLLSPLCLLLAVGAHALWLGMPLKLSAPPPGRDAPVLTAVTSTEWKDWTPVLFSLPTSRGFSSVLGRLQADVMPPMTSPLELTGTYSFDPPGIPGAAATSSGPEMTIPIRPVTTAPDGMKPPPSPTQEQGWVLTALGAGDLAPRFERDPRLRTPTRALRLEGDMRFDAYGQLTSLVVDPNTVRDGWVEQLLPDLRQVRIDPGSAPAAVRFRLRYIPGGGL